MVFFLCTGLRASDMEFLVEGVPLRYCHQKGKKDVLLLDDSSCWELYPLETTVATWSEWWEGIESQQEYPSEFYFDPTDWEIGDELTIYLVENPPIPSHRYLIENPKTGEKGFARFLPPVYLFGPNSEMVDTMKQFPVSQDDPIHKIIPYFENGVIILEDQSLRKVMPIMKREQTWSERWHGKEVEPPLEEFGFYLQRWGKGQKVKTHKFCWVKEGTPSRYSPEGEGIYLLENSVTGDLAYVYPLSLDGLIDLYEGDLLKAVQNMRALGILCWPFYSGMS